MFFLIDFFDDFDELGPDECGEVLELPSNCNRHLSFGQFVDFAINEFVGVVDDLLEFKELFVPLLEGDH